MTSGEVPYVAVSRSVFGRDAGASLLGSVFTRGGLFLLQIGVARFLGVSDFNLFVTASVAGALVYVFGDLGLRQASLLVTRGHEEACRALVAKYRRLRLVSLVVGTAVGAVGAILFTSPDRSGALAALLLVGSYAIQSYSRFLRSPMRAGARVVQEARIEVAERLVMVALGCLALATRSLTMVAASQVGGALVGWWLSNRRLGTHSFRRVTLDRPLIPYALVLTTAMGAPLIYARIDYLVLLRVASDRTAAVYAAAYSLLLAASMAQIALAEAALAHLPRDRAGSGRYQRMTLAVCVIGAGVITLVGPVVVREVFALDHADLPKLCGLLGLAYFVMGANSTLGVLAPLDGRERTLLKIVAAAGSINLALCLWLIPSIGILGGATATLLTEVFIAVAWAARSRPNSESVVREPPILTLG